MGMSKPGFRWAVLAPLAVALAGCGGSDKPPEEVERTNVVQPGAPGEASRKLSPE